jgi:SPP1 gp7 family putative phage head morphogenesis protein
MTIPELDPQDYDPENLIPEEVITVLLTVIPIFENARRESIIAYASKNYIQGNKIAYTRLKKPFKTAKIEDDVYAYLKEYKKQIDEGYTIIQNNRVYWLKDRTLQERQQIFKIISNGIVEGKTPNVVRQEFQDYFSMLKSDAERISRTETAYVQCQGRDSRYKKFGVEKVKWLLGSHPCPKCQSYGGKIYTWDELPYYQPVHPACTCDLSPIID